MKKQRLPNGKIVWIAIEAIQFPTFFDLIVHYMKKGNPINPEVIFLEVMKSSHNVAIHPHLWVKHHQRSRVEKSMSNQCCSIFILKSSECDRGVPNSYINRYTKHSPGAATSRILSPGEFRHFQELWNSLKLYRNFKNLIPQF